MNAIPDSTLPTLEQTFSVATELVVAALTEGITPTAATLKLQMRSVVDGFTERAYGFRKFIDYLEAAESAGHVRVDRDISGHPRISLPGTAALVPATTTKSPKRRLRSDLWSAVVSWDAPAARYWDRLSKRAYLVPVDQSGRPLWETETDRFTHVEPVSRETHLEWMQDFVGHLDQGEAKDALASSLRPDATPGSFKRTLMAHELGHDWQTLLTTCVMNHTLTWASEQNVPINDILETRRRPTRPEDESVATGQPEPGLRKGERASAEDPESLRRALHAVIDSMSLSELAALPIPAGYLVSR
jgi:hypothetical protein